MKPIGALGGAGRMFGPVQPKPVSPDAEGERDKGGFEKIRNAEPDQTKRPMRPRSAEALNDAKARGAADYRSPADRELEARRKSAFRARVARAVERIESRAEQRVDRLAAALDAGRLTSRELQTRLEARFGERADGIVGDDGGLDRARLKELFTRVGLRHLHERIDALREDRTPDAEPALAPEAVPEPGSILSVEV